MRRASRDIAVDLSGEARSFTLTAPQHRVYQPGRTIHFERTSRFHGFRDGRVFVRLDGPAANSRFEIEFDGATSETRSARDRIAELEAPITGERFRVVATRDGLAPMTMPENGWIDVA